MELQRCKALPRLLEPNDSPSPQRLRWYWRYLDKWRRCLFRLWCRNISSCTDESTIAKSVDDFIGLLLLVEYLRQSEHRDLPRFCDVYGSSRVCGYAIGDFVSAVTECLGNPFLATILNSEEFLSLPSLPVYVVKRQCDRRISAATGMAFHDQELPLTLFGDFYQMCIGFPLRKGNLDSNRPSARRASGIFYTPAPIVDYLVNRSLTKLSQSTTLDKIEHLRVLDPSCGCGAFLIGSLRFLVQWCRQHLPGSGNMALVACQFMANAFRGYDIDSTALQWTEKLLLLAAWQSIKRDSDFQEAAFDTTKIPNFKEILSCKNFLELPHGTSIALSKPEYDLIIGGPPFVRLNSLHRTQKEQLRYYRQRFLSAWHGQFDLYMLFIEQAIGLLKPEGLLAFSLSNTFLRSEGGRYVRGYLAANSCIEEILEIEDPRTYGDATAQIVLLHAKKTKRSSGRYVFVKGQGKLREKLDHLSADARHSDVSIVPLEAKATASSRWHLLGAHDTDWLESIRQIGIPLGQAVVVKYGFGTGLDDVLVLKKAGVTSKGTVCVQCRKEKAIARLEAAAIRPIIRGHQLKTYKQGILSNICLFPFDERGRVIPEPDFQKRYPMAYRFLLRHQDELSQRKMANGCPWYSTFVRLPGKSTNHPRLMTSRIISGNSFKLIVDSTLLAHNSVAILTPRNGSVDYRYLLGVLNSKVFARYVALTMPRININRFSLRLQPLRRFPIPLSQNRDNDEAISRIVTLVDQWLDNPLSSSELSDAIETEVWQLYTKMGMTPNLPTG